MPRLLPVECGAAAREDLDFGGTPRNPQEYLRQVQYVQHELSQLPGGSYLIS